MRISNRIYLVLLPVLVFSLQGRAQRVLRHKVPAEVQESFKLAHKVPFFSVVHWDWTEVGYCARYSVNFKETSSLFQNNGEWVSTRWAVQEAMLPLKAHDFISSKYAFYNLRSCTYEEDRWQGHHYYALFSIRGIEGYVTEVCFDMQGNVVSIDGEENADWDEFEPLNEEEVLQLQHRQVMRAEDSVAERSIGFFAWKEDYYSMKRKTKPDEPVLAQNGVNKEEKEQEEFTKEKERQTKRIYRPQSQRDYNYTRVLAQTKRAKDQEKDLLAAATPAQIPTQAPKEETPAPVETQPEFDHKIVGLTAGTSPLAATSTAPVSVKTVFPAAIQQVFDKRFPKAENPKYFRDTNGNYRAVFVNFGQKAEAVIMPDGTHITTALFFNKKDVSYPIQQYIISQPVKLNFAAGKRIVYESRYRGRFSAAEKPQNYYEVIVWEKNKEDKSRIYHLLRFDHKGHFVSSITPYDYVGTR